MTNKLNHFVNNSIYMVSRESTKKYEVCIFALSLNSHSLAAAKSFLLGGAHRQYFTHSITETKSKKMLYYLTAVVFGMVGLTYAAVPLYRTFCQATGYGGTVQRKEVYLIIYITTFVSIFLVFSFFFNYPH